MGPIIASLVGSVLVLEAAACAPQRTTAYWPCAGALPQVEGYFRTTLGTNSYWVGMRNTANYRPSLVNKTGAWDDNRQPVPGIVPAALAGLQVQAAHGTLLPSCMLSLLLATACYCLPPPATACCRPTGIGIGIRPAQQQAG